MKLTKGWGLVELQHQARAVGFGHRTYPADLGFGHNGQGQQQANEACEYAHKGSIHRANTIRTQASNLNASKQS